MTIDTDILLNMALPKWPQMRVSGKSVTVEQAKEIIFRTDYFLVDGSEYSGGNNHHFNKEYRRKAGLDRFDVDMYSKLSDDPKKARKQRDERNRYWAFRHAVPLLCGHISTHYVRNDWASCAYIFGAHGWCSPKGDIHYVDNVGKWPSASALLSDWTAIADAFPYLDVHVTIMDDEVSNEDAKPLFNIRVVDGKAQITEPDLSVHPDNISFTRNMDDCIANLRFNREIGLPLHWYDEYAQRVYSITSTLTNKSLKDAAKGYF